MNGKLVTTFLWIFFIIFILFPFASLAMSMLLLLVTGFIFLGVNLLQAILGNKPKTP
jgi:uncharacterized protein YhhL (DUF1145 family)